MYQRVISLQIFGKELSISVHRACRSLGKIASALYIVEYVLRDYVYAVLIALFAEHYSERKYAHVVPLYELVSEIAGRICGNLYLHFFTSQFQFVFHCYFIIPSTASECNSVRLKNDKIFTYRLIFNRRCEYFGHICG